MLRTPLAFLALLPALALGGPACTGEADSGGEAVTEAESAIPAPRYDLYGTYRSEAKLTGQLPLLVLMSDGTYHRTIRSSGVPTVPDQSSPPRAVDDDGTFLFWGRDGATFVTFYPDDGSPGDRYQFAHAGDALRMRRMPGFAWFTLRKTINEAWCEEPRDCELQHMPVGPRAGEWQCVTATDTCRYTSGSPL